MVLEELFIQMDVPCPHRGPHPAQDLKFIPPPAGTSPVPPEDSPVTEGWSGSCRRGIRAGGHVVHGQEAAEVLPDVRLGRWGEHLSPNNPASCGPRWSEGPWDVQTVNGKVQSRRKRSGLPRPTPTTPLNDSASWNFPCWPCPSPSPLAQPLAGGLL